MKQYSEEEIKLLFDKLYQICKKILDKMRCFFKRIFEGIKPNMVVYDEWHKKEPERKKRKALYKLDFNRPLIKHQVLDRKPKQLIKKVIH